MSPRRPPRVRPSAAALVATLVLLGTVVLSAAASADDRAGEPVATPAAVVRVNSAPASTGLADTGPAVPILVALTVLMLLGGAVVLWQRCREQSASAAARRP